MKHLPRRKLWRGHWKPTPPPYPLRSATVGGQRKTSRVTFARVKNEGHWQPWLLVENALPFHSRIDGGALTIVRC